MADEQVADLVAVLEWTGLRVISADLPPNSLDGTLLYLPQYEAAVALINRANPSAASAVHTAYEYGNLLLHWEHRFT